MIQLDKKIIFRNNLKFQKEFNQIQQKQFYQDQNNNSYEIIIILKKYLKSFEDNSSFN